MASFSGCASASGPRLPGSGLRPLQARPSASAASLPDPRVSHAAGRLRPGPPRRSPRRVRSPPEAWPQRQSERTEAFISLPPHPQHTPALGTRGPFPPGPQAGGPGACEAAGAREGRPRRPAAPRGPRPPRPRRPRGSEAARPSLRRASALAPGRAPPLAPPARPCARGSPAPPFRPGPATRGGGLVGV